MLVGNCIKVTMKTIYFVQDMMMNLKIHILNIFKKPLLSASGVIISKQKLAHPSIPESYTHGTERLPLKEILRTKDQTKSQV